MGDLCRLLNSFLPRALFFCTIAIAGCRNNDLVEAELRSRESELRHVRSELQRLEGENQALSHELGCRHEGATPIPPEAAAHTFRLKQITLGRLTGGYSEDNVPGARTLRVIVEPRDLDGHVVKATGTMHVEVLEISSEGLKTALSAWDVDSRQLARTWQAGMFTTGYVVIFPWKNWPSSDKLRVIAQLKLPDGRMFETDRDITVHLPGKGLPRSAPMSAPSDGPSLPMPLNKEALPLPRKACAAGWQRTIEGLPGEKTDAGTVQAAAWTPSEAPSLSAAVRVLKPVVQTSDEWPPR